MERVYDKRYSTCVNYIYFVIVIPLSHPRLAPLSPFVIFFGAHLHRRIITSDHRPLRHADEGYLPLYLSREEGWEGDESEGV
jgi:hypothetical protein